MRTRSRLLTFILFFCVLGLADAIYLTFHELTNTALNCVVGSLSGCNIVAQSQYSKMFGIPLGVYGIVFYCAVLVLTAILLKRSELIFIRLLALLATAGFLFSIYFAYLQIYVIKAICIYCMISAVLSIAIFVVVMVLWRNTRPPLVIT